MRNMRWLKISALILVMMVAVFIAAPESVWAADASGVFDEGNLLTDSEEASLMKKIGKYSVKYESDIAIVTTQNAGGQTAKAYADAYAEKIGQSMTRDERAGILFLIDMDNREIYIATQGKAMNYYDTDRIDRVLDQCYDRIVDGEYEATCDAFLAGVHKYMGRNINQSGRMGVLGVLVRLLIALGVGGGVTFAMVHKSGGRVTTSGATYFDTAQSKMEGKNDRFINRTVTRRVIPKPQNNGGGRSSGGGGIHVSSGGGMHGGGGRKF